MELIRIQDLYKTYHLGEVDVPVLRGISLTIQHGEMVALMGASGSGKTTLMNILGCLDRPSSGEFWLDGEDMSGLTPNERALVRTKKLGFVFQSFNLLPRTSALNNVIMPLDYAPKWPSHAESERLATMLLDRVGLADRLDHEPSQMSGGQQQRVAIARSLVNRPALVLADEPTGNLDSKTSVEILQMFRELNREGITVILVTHDPKVATFADRVIRLKDGQVESDGAPDTSAAHGGGEHGSSHNGSPQNGSPQNGAAHTGESSADRLSPALPSAAHLEQNGNSGSPVGSGMTGSGGSTATAVVEASPQTPAVRVLGQSPAIYGEQAAVPVGLHLTSFIPPTLRSALNALRRNKMRSLLTALGVIIGVAAVIAMVEIGQGSKTTIQNQIASMGANTLLLQSGAASSSGVNFGVGTVMSLTPQDAEEVGAQCPAVADVAPIVRSRVQLVYLNRNWAPTFIYGTTPSFLVVRDWEDMSEGAIFSDRDVNKAGQVCVIGETIKRELFQGDSPVGKEIRMHNVSFKVIGVLSKKGANGFGMDQDDVVLAPWTTIKYRVSGTTFTNTNQSASAAGSVTDQVNTLDNLYPGSPALYPTSSSAEVADRPQPIRVNNVDQILVKAASTDEIPDAMNQITDLMRDRHHLRDKEDDFNIRDMTEFTNTLGALSRTMSGLLLVVALISLVVGGVGIMNIMLVSVTERTREIGLRMAVGARSHHILKQFLVEAIVLCLLGGAVGILVGRGASWLVRSVMHWPTEPSLLAIVGAVVVSATVGIVFGFYPAWKASRLDPIEALRYE